MLRRRVGLVGGGPWARTVHGPALAAHPRIELTGVWTRRPEAAAELAAELGTRAVPQLDDLLAQVDAVAFAVPPQAQGDLAVRAAAAGRHLILEKPLADPLPAARAVVDAVQHAGVHSSLVLTLRHDPAVRAWLAGLPAATAGPDTVGSARWLSGALLGNSPYAASAWRVEQGALLDIGPHVFDLLEMALGAVTAVDWAYRDEPDLWRIGCTHAGGAHSTATLSLRVPLEPTEVEFAVFGPAGRHQLGRVSGGVAAYTHLLDELLAAIDGTGPPPELDAARGLRLQELIDEVRARAT